MCAATDGGVSIDGVDLSKQAVIQGVVYQADEPLAGAYVRLLDSGGEFVAELPSGSTGQFRFFAAPGAWTVRTLAPGVEPVDRPVIAARGQVVDVDVVV